MEPHPENILVKNSPIHGRGIYATKDFEYADLIVEYTGEKITKAEARRRGEAQMEKAQNSNVGAVYIYELNKRYDLDGNIPENDAKYVNHSCSPTAQAVNIRGKIYIQSLADIKKGDEITIDYGFAFENWEDHPCLCGTKGCVGYVVAEQYRSDLKKALKDKKKKKKKSKKKEKSKS